LRVVGRCYATPVPGRRASGRIATCLRMKARVEPTSQIGSATDSPADDRLSLFWTCDRLTHLPDCTIAKSLGGSFPAAGRKWDGTGAVAVAPELALERMDFDLRAISPLRELGAYEALWDKPNVTFKTLSEKFAARPDAVPSDFVPPAKAREYAEFVQRAFAKRT